MQLVKYINELNDIINFDNEEHFFLSNITGTGNVAALHINTKNSYQNGAKRSNSTLDVRHIELHGTITACDRTTLSQLKEKLCEVFNPLLRDGKLYYDAGNGEKFIYAIAEETPIFSEYRTSHVDFIVYLICHDPLWHDLDWNEHLFTTPYTSSFQFPNSFRKPSFQMGYQTETRQFENTGGVRVPLILEFYGDLKTAKFTNKTNGEWIEFKKSLDTNETLLINSGNGCKEVKIIDYMGNEKNGYGILTFDCSTYIHLEKGINTINFIAESDNKLAKVKIKWIKSYLGV